MYHPRAQEADPVVTWQVVVNQARLGEGLAPYGFSSLLTAAAQRHANDVAANGLANPGNVHVGSDGTLEQERAADAGYAAWSDGGVIVDENVSTYDAIEESMAFFLGSTVHRDNILSTKYREIGIGVATDADGGRYHVLVFGVRPNVLPVFINDGSASTDNPEIAIRLTNEEAWPEGEGANFMGRAIEVRISDDPGFDDMPWQPWDAYVSWTLPNAPGEHTVYVQFRDAAGRTAASPDTIVLEVEASGAPTAVPASPTPQPTATPVPPSPTPEPTATSAPTATPAPTAVPTPEPTPVEPTVTPLPPPTPSPLETPTIVSATPFPTWTPLPTPVVLEPSTPDLPLGTLAVLQGVALILGAYLVLRRGR